jgi:hypothetical protein
MCYNIISIDVTHYCLLKGMIYHFLNPHNLLAKTLNHTNQFSIFPLFFFLGELEIDTSILRKVKSSHFLGKNILEPFFFFFYMS